MVKRHFTFENIFRKMSKIEQKITSIKRESISLKISERQLYRYYKAYKEGRLAELFTFTVEKRQRAISNDTIATIVELKKTKYKEFNIMAFNEHLRDDEKIFITYPTLYRILAENGLYSPLLHRATKKKIKKALRDKSTNSKIHENLRLNDTSCDNYIANRLAKIKYKGTVIEMDASQCKFPNGEIFMFHLAVDDASKCIVGARIDKQETLNGYYHVMYQMLNNYGIPVEILTDNRTVFELKKTSTGERSSNTHIQFRYACEQLGIELCTTSIATQKARVERANGTVQRRIMPELKLKNINSIDEANEYLVSTLIPHLNDKYSLNIKKSIFKKVPDYICIENVLAVVNTRKIDKAGCISYKSRNYLPVCNDHDQLKVIKNIPINTSALFIETFDKRKIISVGNYLYRAMPVEEIPISETAFSHPGAFSYAKEKTASEKDVEKTRKVADTPWRYDMFKFFLKRQDRWTNYM